MLDQILPNFEANPDNSLISTLNGNGYGNTIETSNKKMLINSFDYDIYYKQWIKGRNNCDISRLNYSSYVILPNLLNALSISTGYRKYIFKAYAENNQTRYIDQSYKKEEIFISIRSKIPIRHSKISFELSNRNYGSDLNLSISGESRISKLMVIHAGYENTNHIRPFNLAYDSAKISIQMPVNENKYYVELSSKLQERVASRISYSHSNLTDNNNDNNISYDIISTGTVDALHTNFAVMVSKKVGFELELNRTAFREDVDFHNGNLKFGQMGVFQLDFYNISPSICYQFNLSNSFVFKMQENKSDFYSRGHIDSWPFADFLEQLLGSKVYFKTNGSILTKNANIIFNHISKNNSGYSINMGYSRFEPDGQFISWNPAFLGMGVINRQSYEDNIKYMDTMKLGLTFNIQIRQIFFRYSVQQYIPLKIALSSGADSDTDLTQPANTNHITSFGGSFHKLTICLEL